MIRWTRSIAVVVVGVGLAAVAGCGSDEDRSSSSPDTAADTVSATTVERSRTRRFATTGESSTTAAPEPQGFSAAALLAHVPASRRPEPPTPMIVIVGDLDRASELAGVERPTGAEAGDGDAVLDWVAPLSGLNSPAGVAVLLPQAVAPQQLGRNPEIAELGWSVLDVHSFVELQNPPDTFAVLATDATEGSLTAAIGAPVDGVWRLGGEDGEMDLKDITAGRRLGESVRFGLRDGYLAASRTTPPVAEWLDGSGETLADDEALASVATALDEAAVYSAMLVGADGSVLDFAWDGPVLEPFDVLGIGLSVVDGEPLATYAYHTTTEAADANVELVRQVFAEGTSFVSERPLTEMFTLQDAVAKDKVVVATVSFADSLPMNVWQLIYSRELPTVHR